MSAKLVCLFCKGSHVSMHCNIVTDVNAQADLVKREQLCYNCLGHHKVSNCTSKNWCKGATGKLTPADVERIVHQTHFRIMTHLRIVLPLRTIHIRLHKAHYNPTCSLVPTTAVDTKLTTTHILLKSSEHSSMIC